MASVRTRGTGPELAVRKALHRAGFRFRLHRPDLPGTPDIVLPRLKAIVLVHGCFWHRHEGCRYATSPKSNHAFWRSKFKRNVRRDHLVVTALQKAGWKVNIIWQCETRSPTAVRRLIARLARLRGAVLRQPQSSFRRSLR